MYEGIRFSGLISALQNRLSDPDGRFWSEREVRSYLIEALRTWQVFSASFSTKTQIPTVSNTLFYDLFALVPELTPTVTDAEVIRDVSFATQEPYDFVAKKWIGTEQFSSLNVYQALQQRRDKFLLETGLVLKNTEVDGPAPTTQTIKLAQGIIDVRGALWKDGPSSVYSLLWRADFEHTTSQPYLELTPGDPSYFLTYPERPLMLDILPPPVNNGKINLLTVNAGAALNPLTPSVLGIPDDFCWVLKMGVLADLFGTDGPGQDDARAMYFESRWKDGVSLARITNFVRLGQNNGVPWFIDSIAELNSGDTGWMSRTPGQPETLAVAGNMVATGPVADAVYSMLFYIMPKFPIPLGLGDYIQIGPEVIDVILDYAQHLADAKEGAAELQRSSRQHKNMIELAAVQNDRLRAQAQNFDVLSDRSLRDKKENIRRYSTLRTKELDYANR